MTPVGERGGGVRSPQWPAAKNNEDLSVTELG